MHLYLSYIKKLSELGNFNVCVDMLLFLHYSNKFGGRVLHCVKIIEYYLKYLKKSVVLKAHCKKHLPLYTKLLQVLLYIVM